MKRFLVVLGLLALLATGGFGSQGESKLLVTPDGVVYLVEVVSGAELDADTTARSALKLRITNGETTTETIVPASAIQGENSHPALGYDASTKTLFIFWVREPHITTSELLLTSYRDGEFGETTALDLSVFRFRKNLQVAITKYAENTVEVEGEEKKKKDPILAVHAVWWDTNGWSERARYALLQISGGTAKVVDIRDLVDIIGDDRNLEPVFALDSSDFGILQFPSISANPALDRTDIVFGDPEANRLYRVELLPVAAHGVLRPPIGIRRGAIPGPAEAIEANSTTTVVPHPADPTSLMVYTVDGEKVRYLVYEGGEWSEPKAIALDRKVSAGTAVDALKRRLAER